MEIWTQRVTCKVNDARMALTLHGAGCIHTQKNEIRLLYLHFIFHIGLLVICETLI